MRRWLHSISFAILSTASGTILFDRSSCYLYFSEAPKVKASILPVKPTITHRKDFGLRRNLYGVLLLTQLLGLLRFLGHSSRSLPLLSWLFFVQDELFRRPASIV